MRKKTTFVFLVFCVAIHCQMPIFQIYEKNLKNLDIKLKLFFAPDSYKELLLQTEDIITPMNKKIESILKNIDQLVTLIHKDETTTKLMRIRKENIEKREKNSLWHQKTLLKQELDIITELSSLQILFSLQPLLDSLNNTLIQTSKSSKKELRLIRAHLIELYEDFTSITSVVSVLKKKMAEKKDCVYTILSYSHTDVDKTIKNIDVCLRRHKLIKKLFTLLKLLKELTYQRIAMLMKNKQYQSTHTTWIQKTSSFTQTSCNQHYHDLMFLPLVISKEFLYQIGLDGV